MEIVANFDDLKARYPAHVAEVEERLRKGKSKHKGDALETFDWSFSYAVVIEQSYTFADILSGKRIEDEAKEAALSEDEKVADYARRCRVTLRASKGRGYWFSELLAETPPEILAPYRAQVCRDKAERARIAALTPEQLKEEREAILRELRGSPGFVELPLPSDVEILAGED